VTILLRWRLQCDCDSDDGEVTKINNGPGLGQVIIKGLPGEEVKSRYRLSELRINGLIRGTTLACSIRKSTTSPLSVI